MWMGSTAHLLIINKLCVQFTHGSVFGLGTSNDSFINDIVHAARSRNHHASRSSGSIDERKTANTTAGFTFPIGTRTRRERVCLWPDVAVVGSNVLL